MLNYLKIEFFECGHCYTYGKESIFLVESSSDIVTKIIPFLEKYPIVGAKALDYADFKKIVEIMKVGGHLTISGLEQIRKIKAGMNTGRES